MRRDSGGKLNIREPIGDFILRGPDSVVKDAASALSAIDVGSDRSERVFSLRYLNVADAKKRLDELYGSEGLQTIVAPGRKGGTPAMVANTGQVGLMATPPPYPVKRARLMCMT